MADGAADTASAGWGMTVKKCAKVNTNAPRFCFGMQKVLEVGGSARLRVTTYLNMTTQKISRRFVTLHSGEFRKQGVVLNHCPFCAAKIDQAVTR